jgi:hypothetical protein
MKFANANKPHRKSGGNPHKSFYLPTPPHAGGNAEHPFLSG